MAHATTLDGLSGNCESRLRRAAARTYLEIRRHVNDKILICKPITVILGKDSQSIRQMQYCPFIFDFVFPLEKRVKAAHTFRDVGISKARCRSSARKAL
jgi:hypothetical protein